MERQLGVAEVVELLDREHPKGLISAQPWTPPAGRRLADEVHMDHPGELGVLVQKAAHLAQLGGVWMLDPQGAKRELGIYNRAHRGLSGRVWSRNLPLSQKEALDTYYLSNS